MYILNYGLRTIELGTFNGLSKLTELYLFGNEIDEIIPGTFENINSLEYLNLEFNRLKHVNSDLFSGLLNLKYVDLRKSNLQYLHPDTFLGLQNLQIVVLEFIPSLQIPTDRNFINSHSLLRLYISSCNISSVSVDTFANLSALELLDLSDNNLKTVDKNILRALPELSSLLLYGNPLHWDCQLQEVLRWCKNSNIQTAYGDTAPECDTPKEVEGI